MKLLTLIQTFSRTIFRRHRKYKERVRFSHTQTEMIQRGDPLGLRTVKTVGMHVKVHQKEKKEERHRIRGPHRRYSHSLTGGKEEMCIGFVWLCCVVLCLVVVHDLRGV